MKKSLKIPFFFSIIASLCIGAFPLQAAQVKGFIRTNTYKDVVVSNQVLSFNNDNAAAHNWCLENQGLFISATGQLAQGFENQALVVSHYSINVQGIVSKNMYGDILINYQNAGQIKKLGLLFKSFATRAWFENHIGYKVAISVGHIQQGFEAIYADYQGPAISEFIPFPILNSSKSIQDLYYLRYYVNPSVDYLYSKVGGPKVHYRMEIRNGMHRWITVTDKLLIRERDEAAGTNLFITTADLGNVTTLVSATPSRPGLFQELKITLNSRFQGWTPDLMQAAIVRGMGIVIGIHLLNEDFQIMSVDFAKSLKSGIFDPQLKDIEEAQKIYGSPKSTPPIPEAEEDLI